MCISIFCIEQTVALFRHFSIALPAVSLLQLTSISQTPSQAKVYRVGEYASFTAQSLLSKEIATSSQRYRAAYEAFPFQCYVVVP